MFTWAETEPVPTIDATATAIIKIRFFLIFATSRDIRVNGWCRKSFR
jgi:hypothetical protein